MDCSVNRTLELNKYLVSIIKIAIKNVNDNQLLEYDHKHSSGRILC